MKKLFSMMLVCCMALTLLVGCGGSNESSGETLRVGLEIGYPPMEYFDEDGTTPIGYDVEVANAIGEILGMDIELIDTAWDGIFAGVETDKYDVIISSVSYNEDRAEKYELTNTYIANAPVLVVPKGSDIKGLEDLKDKSVGVQAETTSDDLMKEKIDEGLETNLQGFDKVIDCFTAFKNGQIDAVMTDSVVAQYYLGEDASSYDTVWQSPTTEPIVMCIKKGNTELKDSLNDALQQLIDSGKLTEIGQKYFGYDVTENLK